MIFDTNDPRLTAYALGEIDPAERSEIEQLLADREEARNYVAEIRQTAQWLAEELQKEPETVSTLAMANHRLIDQALKSAVPTANSRPWWRRPYRLMSMAATLLMGGTVGLFSWNAYQTGRQARNVFNPLPPLSKPRASTPAKSPDRSPRRSACDDPEFLCARLGPLCSAKLLEPDATWRHPFGAQWKWATIPGCTEHDGAWNAAGRCYRVCAGPAGCGRARVCSGRHTGTQQERPERAGSAGRSGRFGRPSSRRPERPGSASAAGRSGTCCRRRG